jgi:tripartite-type tricarboxylate transporter receptor subunit TctC
MLDRRTLLAATAAAIAAPARPWHRALGPSGRCAWWCRGRRAGPPTSWRGCCRSAWPEASAALRGGEQAGAGGNIGTDAIAKAAPDGYTMGPVTVGGWSINQYLYTRLPYDPERDIVPVSMHWELPNVFAVPAQHVPARTLQEFVAWAKQRREGVSYGSPGVGTTPHLSGAMFAGRAGLDAIHVPFRGAAQTIPAMLSGDVTFALDNLASYVPVIQEGRMRALAVTSAERWPTLPEVPTMAEAGVPDFVVTSWCAFAVPRGVPRAIIDRVNAGMREAAEDPPSRSASCKRGHACCGRRRRTRSPARRASGRCGGRWCACPARGWSSGAPNGAGTERGGHHVERNKNGVVLLAGLAWLATAPAASALAQAAAPAAAPPAATQQRQQPVVALIATGGTIAMKIDPVRNAPVPAISGEDLLATVPDISKHARIEVNNLSNVPSDYMDPPRWVALTRAVQDTLARPRWPAWSSRTAPTPWKRPRGGST